MDFLAVHFGAASLFDLVFSLRALPRFGGVDARQLGPQLGGVSRIFAAGRVDQQSGLCVAVLGTRQEARAGPGIEISRSIPAASTRARRHAETQRWQEPSHNPWSPAHWGARPSWPGKV